MDNSDIYPKMVLDELKNRQSKAFASFQRYTKETHNRASRTSKLFVAKAKDFVRGKGIQNSCTKCKTTVEEIYATDGRVNKKHKKRFHFLEYL